MRRLPGVTTLACPALVLSLSLAPCLLAAPPGGGPLREEAETKTAKKKAKSGKGAAAEGEAGPASKPKAKAKTKPEHDLVAMGQLKPVKGSDFWTFTHKVVDEKGRAKQETAFVKVAEEATFYRDKAVPVTDLKEEEAIWVFGRPVEQEAPSATGYTGVDRQLKNVAAIVTGDDVKVNTEFKDPRDAEAKWVEASVSKAGPAITANYDGNDFKVVLLGGAAVLRRAKDGDAKLLKSGVWVALALDKSEERPETKSAADAKKASYAAETVIVLDPRLMRIYPMIFE